VKENNSKQRTLWAEAHVEDFLSLPLIHEFVFRNPQTLDRTQKEVADFLLLQENSGVLISQKCQEDPQGRTAEKADLWARKKAKQAVSQLCGALRTGNGRAIWCNHPRRGRVEFSDGLPPIVHGIVIIEILQRVELQSEAADLPLEFNGCPITYLSLNDFLNLALQLRTLPECLDYLEARRSLPLSDLRTIGSEKPLFDFYLLNDGSFAGCLGTGDARIAVAGEQKKLTKNLEIKAESDRYSGILEHVANELSTRHSDWEIGLSPETLSLFDPSDKRQNYLKIQRVLANLRLRERAELGRAFHETSVRVGAEGFTFKSVRLDSRPDWIYIFGASRKINRGELLSRSMPGLMGAALAYYSKSKGIIIVDRDLVSYEVGMSRPEFEPTSEYLELGQQLFSHLRETQAYLSLVPNTK
jgi:hypothetical protein